MSYEPNFDTNKSLLELAPEAWEDAELDDELRILALRAANKPVRRLNPAELLGLVEHQVCLPYTVPMAVQRLGADPFLQARGYAGDLLTALLETDTRYWLDNPPLWHEVVDLLTQVLDTVRARMEAQDAPEYMPWFVGDEFIAAVLHFSSIHKQEGGES